MDPAELETPNRPTSSGLQSPVGVPVQLGPSPQTREYVHPAPCCIPPAQWGDVHARESEEECELFGEMPSGDDLDLLGNPLQNAGQQDELENAGVLHPVHEQSQPISGARCVNGNLVRPVNSEEEPPSTACRQSTVHASGGVALGRGPPAFGKSPGGTPGRQIPPPPPPGGGNPGGNAGGSTPPGQTPPQQSGGAGCPGGTPPTPPGLPHSGRYSDPWVHWIDPGKLYRSSHCPPTIRVATYWTCNRFWKHGMISQHSPSHCDGDAQRHWLTQALDCARSKHDTWLQSTPSQRASLEPAYILGDRKHIPEAQNAVESVLRTELLDAILKSVADACMRHGYCTAELIVWYVMKQLILPPDINEVTMQKEILTPAKVSPATLDHDVAGRDATSIEAMYQDKAESASKDYRSICE